jgi:hypothetical protein
MLKNRKYDRAGKKSGLLDVLIEHVVRVAVFNSGPQHVSSFLTAGRRTRRSVPEGEMKKKVRFDRDE